MLSSCLFKKPIYVNHSLAEYCRKSTEESIRKISEKYNLERNKPNLSIRFDNEDNTPKFKHNIYIVLLFLSISTMSFYFFKRLH